MDTLIAIYLENIETSGQTGFEFFEDEAAADNHLQKVINDIKSYGKELEFKAVKREVSYDKHNNRVSFS
ncbi:hypothetical protein GCM10008931_43350 [Oceanobacillus oncorhynchi subsp. oncorhynchi]|uniref:hypothetical protein n=1 Tax=Oceanobacillus oncorhynchi TaxID=545501 RepID=UPI0031D71D97